MTCRTKKSPRSSRKPRDENMTQTQVDDAVVAIAMADTSIIQDEEVKASVENGSIEEPKENSVKSTCAAPPASKSGQHQDLLRVQTSKMRLETAKPSRFNATVDATTASHSKNRIVIAEVAGIAKILPRQEPTCSPAKADIHETCHGASALTIHDPKPDNQQETKTTKRSAQTKTSHLEVTDKCLSSNLVVTMSSRESPEEITAFKTRVEQQCIRPRHANPCVERKSQLSPHALNYKNPFHSL
ncbi:unnamed protein product [Aphanomyces euteiches]